ncbi:hypothetical protein GCM10011506_01940 [Marivirga lumbricoides]|uniref:Uncharacterized protein n=2 Tax=Marivirga lumbricoides TaxID=1046115 RepID=A0ABQ1L6Q9_9BACT|nr:hypothetical protein GCM10011506_01940 [Marivirga lumbricoides]
MAGKLTAQVDLEKVPRIGFACGYGGNPTEAVQKVGGLLESENYREIVQLLESGNSAEKFISAVTINYLHSEGIKSIEERELSLILAIQKSTEYICYCYGCTDIRFRMLFEIFEQENYLAEANAWIANYLYSR